MAKISINLKDGNVETPQDVIIGIDLGTTNSLSAYIVEGQPICIKDANSKNTLVPSVVYFPKNGGEPIVGQDAKQHLITEPERTIFSVKRLLGKSYQDLQEVQKNLSYNIIDDGQEHSLVKIEVDNRFYSPIELSAMILRHLKKRVETALNHSVSKAVITVPAYFNDTQRQATKDAGKLAGLEVLRVINEPTAASLAYGIGVNPDEQQTIAVYDLGGGTFDISILQLEGGVFEVLSTHGDTFLGGDDIDISIYNYLKNNYFKDREEDTTFRSELRIFSEKLKKELSYSSEASGECLGQKITFSRVLFNELIQPLVEKTLASCRQALHDAKLQVSDIHKVVMVGGSTRIPYLQEQVSTFFNQKVYDEVNPDEVVALGAAIQADILSGKRSDLLLIDVTPLSLGIETMGGLMDVIIQRNNKIPTQAGRHYTTSLDGQKNLKIAVYQGERDMVQHNRKLGEFVLKGIPPMPAGIPKIEVQFRIDADGILKVKAMELRSKVEQEVQIQSYYQISEEEMSKMLLDSIQHAAEDMKARALIEAENEANYILHHTASFIQQNEHHLTIEERVHLDTLSLALKEAIQSKEKDTIQSAIKKLNDYSAPIAHRMMDRHLIDAMKGKAIE